MSAVCIIPARGGSKRIPGKNIKLFRGKPIIVYSIEAALKSKLFGRVVVSTDSQEIADVATNYGAEVPFFRSEKNADDHATTIDVVKEVYERFTSKPQLICCLYATAPFVTPQLLSQGLHLMQDGGFDSVFPALPFPSAIQRALVREVDGKSKMLYPEYQQTRSQDLREAFYDAGMFYWMAPDRILSKGKIWTENTATLALAEMEAHDIDEPEDWQIAEFKFSLRKV